MPNLDIISCFVPAAQALYTEAVGFVKDKANDVIESGKEALDNLVDKATEAGQAALAGIGAPSTKPNFATDLLVIKAKIEAKADDVQEAIAEFTKKWKKVEAAIGKKISEILADINNFDICEFIGFEGKGGGADGSYDIVVKTPPSFTPAGVPEETLPSGGLGEDYSVLPDRFGPVAGQFTAEESREADKLVNELLAKLNDDFAKAGKYQRKEGDPALLTNSMQDGYDEAASRNDFVDVSDAAFDSVWNILTDIISINGDPINPDMTAEDLIEHPAFTMPSQSKYSVAPLGPAAIEHGVNEVARAFNLLQSTFNIEANRKAIYIIYQRGYHAKDTPPVEAEVKGNPEFDSAKAISGVPGTVGYCARGVRIATAEQGLGKFSGNADTYPGQMAANGYKRKNVSPENAPVGSIITYGDRGPRYSNAGGGAEFGHVEIVAKNSSGARVYVSDHVARKPGGSVADRLTGVWVREG